MPTPASDCSKKEGLRGKLRVCPVELPMHSCVTSNDETRQLPLAQPRREKKREEGSARKREEKKLGV